MVLKGRQKEIQASQPTYQLKVKGLLFKVVELAISPGRRQVFGRCMGQFPETPAGFCEESDSKLVK